MTNEIEKTTDQTENEAKPLKTTGILAFGNAKYLIKQNDGAKVAFEYVDPDIASFVLQEEIKYLPENCFNSFAGVDINRLSIFQLGIAPPQISWVETPGGEDRLRVSIQGSDVFKDSSDGIFLYGSELDDLFLRGPRPDSLASFFKLTTSEQELIGMALKRGPMMLLLSPTIDGVNLNPQGSLQRFIESLYNVLSQDRLTNFQDSVQQRIFEALLRNEIDFEEDASTPARYRQKQINQKIYQIKALLLSRIAEHRKGRRDSELLDLVPFLNDPVTEKVEEGKILKKIEEQPTDVKNKKVISNDLWSGLVSSPDGRLFTPFTKAVPGVRNVNNQVMPDRMLTTKSLTDKEKADRLVRPLESGLREGSNFLKDVPLSEIDVKHLEAMNKGIDWLIGIAQRYMVYRSRVKNLEGAELQLMTNSDIASVSGLSSDLVLNFLAGEEVKSDRQRIDQAFRAWEEVVRPFYRNTESRLERKLSNLASSIELKKSMPVIVDKLTGEFNKLLQSLSEDKRGDVRVGEASFCLLTTQVLAALEDELLQLKEKGQAREIDNFVSYCLSTLVRLRMEIPEFTEFIHQKKDK